MSDITYEMFCSDFARLVGKSRLRQGQCAWNMLWQVRPQLADRVREEQSNDPFYRDEVLPQFFTFVAEEWDWIPT